MSKDWLISFQCYTKLQINTSGRLTSPAVYKQWKVATILINSPQKAERKHVSRVIRASLFKLNRLLSRRYSELPLADRLINVLVVKM